MKKVSIRHADWGVVGILLGRLAKNSALAALCCGLLYLLAASAVQARSSDRLYRFDIDEPTLGAAMDAIVEQTGANVLYPYELASATGMNPVQGRHNLPDAMAILFQRTGFSGSLSERGVIIIAHNHGANAPHDNWEDNMNSKRKTFPFSLAAAFSAMLGLAGVAHAQEPGAGNAGYQRGGGIEEVIVTAQKRSQSAQDVGIAISALSGEALTELGITEATELGVALPGLEIINTYHVSTPTFSIRGLGSFTFLQNTTNSVGIYSDGVAIPYSSGQNFLLFDMERVEVLKGPQSTLYGRNTTGGAINIISAKPTNTSEGYLETTVSEYDTYQVRGAVSGPLSENLQGRLAATYGRSDGFFTNIVNDNDEYTDYDSKAVRNSLAWQPTTALSFEAAALVAELTTGQGGYRQFGNRDRAEVEASLAQFRAGSISGSTHGFANFSFCENPFTRDAASRCVDFDGNNRTSNPYHLESNIDTKQQFDTFNTHLKTNYEFESGMSLTSLTGYQDVTRESPRVNTDAANVALIELAQNSDYTAFSQEFNLQGSANSMDWITGLYLSLDEVDLDDAIFLIEEYQTGGVVNRHMMKQEFSNMAIFGQADYRLTDKISLIAGLRYTSTNLEAAGRNTSTASGSTSVVGIIDVDHDDSAVSGKVGIEWEVSDDTLFYATYNHGFRSGNITGWYAASVSSPTDAETVDAYEIGIKSILLDSSLRFNGAVFFYDFQDLMATGFDAGQAEIVTLGSAEIFGAEADLNWLATDSFALGLTVSLLDTELTELGASETSVSNFSAALGESLAYAPDVSFVAFGRYEMDLMPNWKGFVRANIKYQDEITHQPTANPVLRGDSYTTMDGRVGLESLDGKWQLSVWGKNLNDEEWTTLSFVSGLGAYVTYPNPPRRFGVDFNYRF